MSRALIGILGALVLVGSATATPYWVEYLPSTGLYPEQSGWTRYTFAGGAMRYFEGGALVIDSRASTSTEEACFQERPGLLDPTAPEEWFFMSWRMRIDELQGPWDPTVSVHSDERRSVILDFSLDGISIGGVGTVATFQAGAFHDFEFRSSNMLTFDLFVDSSLVYSGDFTVPLLTASRVGWGSTTSGASLSRWERFSYGVVPEPTSALVGVVLLTVARAVSRRKSP